MNDAQPILMIPKHVSAPIGETARHVRAIGFVIVILALLSVIVSFMVLTGLTPITPTTRVVGIAVGTNGVLLVALAGLIAWELVGLYIAWRDGRAAARLHWRIIFLFSLIAAVPAVIISVFASVTLDRGLDRWFEERTRTIVENAASVGSAYLQEHARALRADTIAMATDIDRAKPLYDFEPERFDAFFETQCSVRVVPAAYILKSDGTVMTKVLLNSSWDNVLMPPPEAFKQADGDEPVIIAPGQSTQVGAVMKLKDFDDLYLYATRSLDARVLGQVRLAQDSAVDYRQLEQSRPGAQMAFALIFVGVSLILLLASIWTAIGFANRLVAPIRRLILAADTVSKGNLSVRVPVRAKEGDLANLGATFNNMTAELRGQRAELVSAKDQIDRRRRFTEAVLAGVTAGVIGIDEDGRITIANRSALALLETSEDRILDRPVAEIVPELGAIVAEAIADVSGRPRQTQVTLRLGGRERSVTARITTETTEATGEGFVITLDDITDLVTAQRSAAWADVARRIAHEIKNPLTPIQLSAERLKRRYGKKVEDDSGVFNQCVDTIIRQVGDIERMVNEFSSFARMPKPQKERGDLAEALREAVFLQSVGQPDIEFETELPETPITGRYDHRLLLQAFTNVVKNATEAIAAVPAENRGVGKIRVRARREQDDVVIEIDDNGVGLPQENRQRLLEPYVTTREKGTGLGLAIVRKIIEDHGGRIDLVDAPAVAQGGRGAMVRIVLPANPIAAASAEPAMPERPVLAAAGTADARPVEPGAAIATSTSVGDSSDSSKFPTSSAPTGVETLPEKTNL